MKCIWCRGTGKIVLKSYGKRKCPNCHGSGEGKDGGDEGIISSRSKPWMKGNKYGEKK